MSGTHLSKGYPFDRINDFNNNRLIAIDTIQVDDHARLTLTRKIRRVLPITAGDTIAIYQDRYNGDELLIKIQRGKDVIDNWVVKRKYSGGINKNEIDSTISGAEVIADSTKLAMRPSNKISCEDDDNNSIYAGKRNQLANILLIDDEEDVLYTFKSVLSSQGYGVTPFREPKEALKYMLGLKNFFFCDLAIIDIRMPGISGIQFYQILRAMNNDIKVLFISALDAVEEALSAFPEIKLVNILRKPTSQTQLVERINEILAQ